jgi:D-sedoheptulose 7-phosphate isomerase
MNKQEFTRKNKIITKLINDIDLNDIRRVISAIRDARLKNKSIFFIGNGGSASTASHMASDIGKNVSTSETSALKRYKTSALTDNVSWITALGNDMSFDDIFVEQLKNLSHKGDVLIVISVSGNSDNIIKAVKWARKHKIKSFGLLGGNGGRIKKLLSGCIVVPSDDYGLVESVHSYIHHLLVYGLKQSLINEKH